nr:MAG TPA: hypothetical protein [Bacteriophage sp.]
MGREARPVLHRIRCSRGARTDFCCVCLPRLP